LIIKKTCEVYSLWFFEELLELIGISRGVHLDLSNGNSITVCGVFLIPRFLFVINTGQGHPFESVHRTILGSLSLLGLVILDGVHIRASMNLLEPITPE
jgi:hypothetical protein